MPAGTALTIRGCRGGYSNLYIGVRCRVGQRRRTASTVFRPQIPHGTYSVIFDTKAIA
jgi:hypothetical protein